MFWPDDSGKRAVSRSSPFSTTTMGAGEAGIGGKPASRKVFMRWHYFVFAYKYYTQGM